MQRTVAVETSRGLRIAKEKASHKIDVIVALGLAALGAAKAGQTTNPADAAACFRLNDELHNVDRWGGFGTTIGHRPWD